LKSLIVPPPKTKDEVWEADGWVLKEKEELPAIMKAIAELLDDYIQNKDKYSFPS
jgi:hypothetical protein